MEFHWRGPSIVMFGPTDLSFLSPWVWHQQPQLVSSWREFINCCIFSGHGAACIIKSWFAWLIKYYFSSRIIQSPIRNSGKPKLQTRALERDWFAGSKIFILPWLNKKAPLQLPRGLMKLRHGIQLSEKREWHYACSHATAGADSVSSPSSGVH